MATINKYETSSGETRYRVLWRDPSGKQKSKSFVKWAKANDFKISLEHSLREGCYVEPSKITVREFIEDWFTLHKKGLQYKTIQGYEYNIKYINSILGDKYLQRLTPGDIEDMYKKLSHLSGKYLQEIHATLNIALKHAVKKRLLSVNPCTAVTRPKSIKYEASFIGPEDVGKYLDLFRNSWAFPAVLLALFCGLRRGEVLALQWSDISYKNNQLKVYKSVIDVENKRELKAPKNNKSRTVDIPPGVINLLKQHKKKQLENKLLLGESRYHDSEYIVREDDGTLPAPGYLSRFFMRRINSSGLPHIRFHDLRHSAASLMLLEGANLKTVSTILGHSSIGVTADIYAHVIDRAKKEAAKSLEKYVT